MTPSALDQMLHDHAARWRERQPELTMPQLTPSTSIAPTRRRRYLAWTGGVVTALLVAALALFITDPPEDTGTTASPSDTMASASDTTASPGDTTARLTRIAARTARQNGDPHVTAQAVETTYRRAERAVFDGDTSSEPSPDSPVWVVQILGDFTCELCSYPAGATAPRGRVITLVLAGAHLTQTDFAIGKHTHELTRLGTVIRLRP